MSDIKIKKLIADTFLEVADALETGEFGKKPVIGVAVEGSEHGMKTIHEAISLAEKKGYKAIVIEGEDVHKKMEAMLDRGEIAGAVTMHYPFPIGVSTIGRVVTPGRGREMYIAATTGTSDTDRTIAMVKNAIYGIIAAKASGVPNPTVGIANIDGARQAEKALLKLKENGYDISFADSARADGGLMMRGNDLLAGTSDIMVMDALTGNLMTKIFSAYTTGGNYESLGWGYGPGIGMGYDKIIMIISRASGAPVIAGAIEYAAELVKNNCLKIAEEEFNKAEKAGLKDILEGLKSSKKAEPVAEVKEPPKEVVTAQISGIEVMDLEDAVRALWKENIYAESGMGCTGPIIRVSEANNDRAVAILSRAGYIQ
ncbi:MAG: glycine/sarcosine/betaine reductase complex component C subunit alpha [Clostridiaceae bacterium]